MRLALLIAGVAALGLWGGLPILLIVLAIVLMIFLHELGHFVTAKWAGMKVTEFFIGFGPRIWSFRRGETEYGFKAIPAGAYVKIIGMHNLDAEVAPEDEPRTYRQKSYPRRLSVAVAGSTMHFLIALVLLFLVLVQYGAPGGTLVGDRDERSWEVAEISKLTTGDSPAQQAGIRLGDRIVAVDGTPTATFDDVKDVVRARPGEDVTIMLLRDGQTVETSTTLASQNPEGEGVGFLGVGAQYSIEDIGALEAVPMSFTELGRGTTRTIGFLGAFFSPSGLRGYVDQVLGRPPATVDEPGSVGTDAPLRPQSVIGIVRIAGDAAKVGLAEVLMILVSINIFVGVFNLIPLLPFDGGHVAIATYERIRSRKGRRYFVDVTRLLPVTYLVVVVLGMLFLTSIYLDVAKPLNPYQ